MSHDAPLPPLRTRAELQAFAVQLAADAEQLAAELRDFSRPFPPGAMVARAADLDRREQHMAEQATDLEVAGVTVPDFPPVI